MRQVTRKNCNYMNIETGHRTFEGGVMRQVTWKNYNHMNIETGHRTFDRQYECLSTGNVSATCQSSTYVRPYTETECNNMEFPLGKLQKFDLDQFKDIPSHVRREVEEMTRTVGGILYEIRHWGKRIPFSDSRQKFIHGYILTSRHDTDIPYRHLKTFQLRHGAKSYRIMSVVREYISEGK